MNMWLVKSEPDVYSWDTFVAEKGSAWTGVRNNQARLNLLAMKVGDRVLYYHSGDAKEVVGIAEVSREGYQDPTAEDPRWICVDLIPIQKLPTAVPLKAFRADAVLADSLLVRHTRLSVMPIDDAVYTRALGLGGI